LNKLVHDLHMTNDLHATKKSIAVTQQKFKDTKAQEPQSISKPVESLKINQDNVIESKQKEKKFSNALIRQPEDRKVDVEIENKRKHVRNMMKDAWDTYVAYAWGYDEVKPNSKGINDRHGSRIPMGTSIVDSMSTLYIMGLDEEFQKGREWIAENFDFNRVHADVSVFETNIRFVGGLLSAYAFTGDDVFKNKAVHVVDKLLPAFHPQSGLPYGQVNMKSGTARNGWKGQSILSEFGTLSMEFTYLSDITGDKKYVNTIDKLQATIFNYNAKGSKDCSFPLFWNTESGRSASSHTSLGAFGDSFFEYLIKEWIRSGHKDRRAKEMFNTASSELESQILKKTNTGLTYVGGDRGTNMEHLACFSGAMYGLAGYDAQRSESRDKSLVSNWIKIGADITQVCHESYAATPTQLGPDVFQINNRETEDGLILSDGHDQYMLRPETAESYFIMWRITHEEKYREWGWQMIQALDKHCKSNEGGGYSGIRDVWSQNDQKDDVQQSWFLAETLKYLYLLFCDDDVISIDKWVFNTEAHPLPIKGQNSFYRDYNEKRKNR